MTAESKTKIDQTLDKMSDEYVNDILQYLGALQLKEKFILSDHSSILISELATEEVWTKEVEEAWEKL